MKSFWMKLINVAAIAAIVISYNQVVSIRAEEDKSARLEAELETEKLKNEQLLSMQVTESSGEDEAEGQYADGIYQGEAEGFGGPIAVSVTVEGGVITDIAIDSAEGEDGTFLEMGKAVIDSMLSEQTTEVDTVSGATFSSSGIINATKEALEEAV